MVKQSICKTPPKDVITQNSLAARCNADREGQRWQLALDLAGGDVVGIGTRLAACEDGRETEGWTGIDRDRQGSTGSRCDTRRLKPSSFP